MSDVMQRMSEISDRLSREKSCAKFHAENPEFLLHGPADIAYLLKALTSLYQVAEGLAGSVDSYMRICGNTGWSASRESFLELYTLAELALARYADWQREHGKAL